LLVGGIQLGVEQTVSEWKPLIETIIDSKVSEFLQMGYSKTTNEDIWECLKQRVWKGNPSKKLHEVVQDILHLSPAIYMSYLTLHAFQDDTDLMASIAALTDLKEEE
jgi:hypothetical protein